MAIVSPDPADADPLAEITANSSPRGYREPAERDPQRMIEQVKRVFSPLERELVGFGPLLIQCIYALLTRENLLVFSPAGTAKTLCASMIFSRIRGARIFDTQMSKGTLAEELFGSVDIEQMKRGRVTHNTCGTLVDADLAFVDEFFDANDMVLRALLGIFNERVFKKGSQYERASLHTGIAAANYVRANDVTEAVLDRFLFRAYIAPDYSPYTLLAIDNAFTRHYGRPTSPPADAQVPLECLSFLADIVRGRVAGHEIAAPPHVLFMKNAVINRYRELIGQRAAAARSKPPYISPRTYAKSRILLNAAALLRGRMDVTAEDLPQLKYVVTTIGGPEEQSDCFEKALAETQMRIRGDDLERIDNLVAANDLAEQVMARLRDGQRVESTGFLDRLLRFFGLKSEGDITFQHVRRYVDGIDSSDEQVRLLKLGVLKRIQELSRRVDRRDGELLG
ncbi:MAG: MoxR family ATPase [Pirellulales bacterium]|nr:MoxR family ATPase [Pirellulales bacterium]